MTANPSPPPVPRTLPSGTVTFLFTDIEGSTKLWEQHPEAMETALAKHDSILKEATPPLPLNTRYLRLPKSWRLRKSGHCACVWDCTQPKQNRATAIITG